jgi:hypothetical protein
LIWYIVYKSPGGGSLGQQLYSTLRGTAIPRLRVEMSRYPKLVLAVSMHIEAHEASVTTSLGCCKPQNHVHFVTFLGTGLELSYFATKRMFIHPENNTRITKCEEKSLSIDLLFIHILLLFDKWYYP